MTPWARRTVMLLFLVAGIIGTIAGCGSDDTEPGAVHVLSIDGAIGPITERYIDRGIDRAADNDATIILIEIDTPGGLVAAMRDIVQKMEASPVPVVTYVTPSGAQAASAGTFITMAGHIAAMSPNTTIGAASVVSATGEDIDETAERKATEDTAAFARGVAELRGRNVEWADDAVREAVSASASEAVELNVVDMVAGSRAGLLEEIDGETVQLNEQTDVRLQGVSEAPVVETNLTGWERFLNLLADPNIAAILLTLGSLGILVEMLNPGLFVPGVAGVICLALGFLGFGVLPVDTVGLALIGIALVLFILEALVASGGILGGGALVALVLGGIIAFRDTPAEFQPSRILVVILVAFIGMMLLSTGLGVWRARKTSLAVGTQALVGHNAYVRTPLNPDGYVVVQGERWRATLQSGHAEPGDVVRIVGADGLHLRVERKEGEPS